MKNYKDGDEVQMSVGHEVHFSTYKTLQNHQQ